jgi:hypothetical protein
MQNRLIIEAAINLDPIATPKEKSRLMAALAPSIEKPRMITRKDVAALPGVHIQTVNSYTRRGLLRAVKFTARAVRYPEAVVLHFMQHGARA